jgi:hypothetical protein
VSCKHGTQDVCTVKKVRKYHSMCKMVECVLAAVETQRIIFIKYQDIPLAKPTVGLKCGERQLDDIWRWVCRSQVYGHGSCKIHYIEKSKKHTLPLV